MKIEGLRKKEERSSKERAATSGKVLPSLEKEQRFSEERGRFSEKAEVPKPKTSKEHARELTLSKEILEQVVEQIGGTVVESPEIPLPQVSSGMAKP